MPVKIIITTPLGEFPGPKAAAAAHGVDRSTIVKRCQSDPANYQRKEVHYEKIKEPKQYAVRGVRWPISWPQYRLQDWDTREAIWEQWYQTKGLDPNAESTVEQFFDEMDTVPDTEDATDEADQEQPI